MGIWDTVMMIPWAFILDHVGCLAVGYEMDLVLEMDLFFTVFARSPL